MDKGIYVLLFNLLMLRKVSLAFLFISIWFYSIMTGSNPPIVRAVIRALGQFINLLTLWSIPFILEAGFVVGLFGLLWTSLVIVPSYLVFPILLYIEQVVEQTARIKLFQVQFSAPRPWVWLSP
jgi:hypothetical protein